MKANAKAGLWLLLTGVMMIVAISCGEQKKEPSGPQMLVVERQSHTYYDDYFTIDVPLYGPKPLMDSLKVFLNKHLYKAFNTTVDTPKFSEKDLFQDDLTGMLAKYAAKYQPNEDDIFDSPIDFSLLLMAQTDSYVTYGLEFCSCGVNCGSEFYCYTFSKEDGHLCEIISRDNLIKFIEDNNWDYKPVYDDYLDHFSFGLLEDGALCAEQSASNKHYVPFRVDIKEIMPYLSDDAQKLIQTQGDIAKYDFIDWSLGIRRGEAETVDGNNAVLFQHLPRWGFNEHEYEEDIFKNEYEEYGSDFFNAVPYVIKDGLYVPCKSDFKTLAFVGLSDDYLIRIDKIEDSYRYSSWKHKFNMDDEPDLVINDGWFDLDNDEYVFENNGYIYTVGISNIYEYSLNVIKDNKSILKQDMFGIVDAYENAYISFSFLGSVVGTDGATINLFECTQPTHGAAGGYTSFIIARDKDFQEYKVFETMSTMGEKYYQSSDTIGYNSAMITTIPGGGCYAFNEEDKTLYCASGIDTYEVYQFDGTHFNYVRDDGGFWLHPSLREYAWLVNIYETKGYIIRIDKIGKEDPKCRYAAWKKGTDLYPGIMAKKPDIIIDNGQLDDVMIGFSEYNVSKFESDGYQYIVDESKRELTVYKGQKLILKQTIENALRF